MIKENVQALLRELPPGVELVGAAKTRSAREILEAVEGGLRMVGQNYVQEAERVIADVGRRVQWHLIGHLQSNKARKAVQLFDMIETLDSLKLAVALDKACEQIGKSLPVLLEINSGEESQKAGVLPREAVSLVRAVSEFPNLRVRGLMTMGPFTGDPEDARPCFRRTSELYEEIKRLELEGAEMRFLSMGMSNSYRVAIEEGANLVRIGTAIFGERE